MKNEVQARERPILFSGPMVRAILEDRKTQTRRIIKPSWIPTVEECLRVNGKWVFDVLDGELQTPYGRDGDRLWVRETWCPWADSYTEEYFRDRGETGKAVYRADHAADRPVHVGGGARWKPSIHMPRWASRIALEITNVRVERLHEISAEDCKHEGLVHAHRGHWVLPETNLTDREGYRLFEKLWNSTGGDWSANPWVWVISFRRVKP